MIFLSLWLACSADKSNVEETATTIDTAFENTGVSEEDTGAEDTADEDTALEDTGTSVDTQDTAVNEACIDVPLITYASFGQGFITFNCQGCHGSGAANRQGAPEFVTFDSHEQGDFVHSLPE